MNKYEIMLAIHNVKSSIGNIKNAMELEEDEEGMYPEILEKLEEKLLFLRVKLARIG